MKQPLLLICFLTAMVVSSVGNADHPPRRIMLLDVESGEYRAVAPRTEFTRQGSPVFSPDETHVAFDARRDEEEFRETRIIVKNLEDVDEPALDLGGGAMPSYSKSGREIAFSLPRGGGVWIMGANGHGEFQLRADAWHIVFSPVDEDMVAYGVRNAPGANIVLHNLDTDETRNVLPDDVASRYGQIYWNFQWSQDGSRIAFKGVRTNGDPVLAVVETQETDPEHYELQALPDHARSWFHPTSSHLYFSADPPDKAGNRIFTIDLSAANGAKRQPQYFLHQPDDHSNDVGAWSADGRRMLIVSSPAADWPQPRAD